MEHSQEETNSIFKVGINLTIACLLSGLIIAGTYAVTAPVAERERENLKTQAMKELVQDAESFKPVDGKAEWFAAVKGGKTIAYVVPAESKGYGGAIKMLAAVGGDGKVIDYKILSHLETPGLGDKATEPKFRKQFNGKSAQDLEVVKVPTDKNIQALTGATITSRAVTKGIREVAEQVAAYAASQQK